MPTQPQILPQLSLKGYRELLKRLRQQSNDEACSSGALFQQAKELALAHLQRKRGSDKINPRRAFSRLDSITRGGRSGSLDVPATFKGSISARRLRQRVLDKKLELKQLKDAKKEKLRATYTALREHRQSRKEAIAEERQVVGSDGLSRASFPEMSQFQSLSFALLPLSAAASSSTTTEQHYC